MKTLRRSTENSVIAGVCGGIAEYLNSDPVLFRIVFIGLAFLGGVGVILYFICWIVMPIRGENDAIQDAEFTDDSEKSAGEKIKDAIKTVAGEFVEGVAKELVQDVAKEIRNERNETREDAKKEAKEDIEKEAETVFELKVQKNANREARKAMKESKKHHHSAGIWFGIMLIFFGVAFLLRTLGLLNFSWHDMWRYWPILLIFVGVACIPMKRCLKATIKVLLLLILLFAMTVGSLFRPFSLSITNDNIRINVPAMSLSVSGEGVTVIAPGTSLYVSDDGTIRITAPATAIHIETTECEVQLGSQ